MGYHYKELTVIELTAEEFELHKEDTLELLTNMRNEEHTKYWEVCPSCEGKWIQKKIKGMKVTVPHAGSITLTGGS
jgi:predicted helicase